jgi:hydroxyacylglutathione hydrolase
MIFEQIRTGGDRNFAYLIGDKESGQAAVVDPSNDPGLVQDRSREHGLDVKFLINTHGHCDHTDGNNYIMSNSDVMLIAHDETGSEDGSIIPMGEVELKIIHTPGHTADSICVLVTTFGEVPRLVTGDTLFVGKVGGTGYGEDARAEYDSLHGKLMILSDDTEVWPGHDYGVAPSSTIANERETNPFLLRETFEDFVDLKRNWAAYKAEHGVK